MRRIFYLSALCLMLACLSGCSDQPQPVAVPDSAIAATPEENAPAPGQVAPATETAAPASDRFDDFNYDDFADMFGEDNPEFAQVADPFEGWNRFWFHFNDILLVNIIKPLYDGYDYIMPDDFQSGIGNFFHNLAMPVRFLNCLLQGKFNDAGVELGAFIINSTVGFGGVMDVASRHPEVQALDANEDFGQTLGSWGVGEGIYLVWPLLGPSTLRDTTGLIGDFFMDPLLYMDLQPYLTIGKAVKTFNNMGDTIQTYETVTGAAIEPYTAMKDAYIQYRRARINK